MKIRFIWNRGIRTPTLLGILCRGGWLVALSCVVAGCNVGPRYATPTPAVPAQYAATAAVKAEGTNSVVVSETEGSEAAIAVTWWTQFEDPTLQVLIERARLANRDLKMAASRVVEARAMRGVTGAGRFPQLTAGAGYQRSRMSENSPNLRMIGDQIPGGFSPNVEFDAYQLDAALSWELDLFGRVRNSNRAARAQEQSAEEAYRGAQVALFSDVGLSYSEYRGRQRQIALAHVNVYAVRDFLALMQDRQRAGLVGELDVERVRSYLHEMEARIPSLEIQRDQARHRIWFLLGKNAGEPDGELDALLNEKGVDILPARIPVGLPSDLMRSRPDIRSAERALEAANARVGVAKAELFPRFFLTGAAGLQSVDTGDLFTGGSRFWSLGPGLSWPIFSAGRLRQNVRVQNARHEQALLSYESTVLKAMAEVEDALVAFGKEQEQRKLLSASEMAAIRALLLAEDRYRGGLVSYLDVLDAQRTLIAVQDQGVQSDRRLRQQLVRLYWALGGGWDPRGHVPSR